MPRIWVLLYGLPLCFSEVHLSSVPLFLSLALFTPLNVTKSGEETETNVQCPYSFPSHFYPPAPCSSVLLSMPDTFVRGIVFVIWLSFVMVFITCTLVLDFILPYSLLDLCGMVIECIELYGSGYVLVERGLMQTLLS